MRMRVDPITNAEVLYLKGRGAGSDGDYLVVDEKEANDRRPLPIIEVVPDSVLEHSRELRKSLRLRVDCVAEGAELI
jgi:hypothetical protein